MNKALGEKNYRDSSLRHFSDEAKNSFAEMLVTGKGVLRLTFRGHFLFQLHLLVFWTYFQ